MVTGRELPDLFKTCQYIDRFDLIVAENGALLYSPLEETTALVAEEAPQELLSRLRERGVPLSVGQSIIATQDTYKNEVESCITELELEHHIILNKGALMILPAGVNKGFGLTTALEQLHLNATETVSIGDAENDISLLHASGFGVAVSNALPVLKQQADWITAGDHGAGVEELIARIIEVDTQKKVHVI